jgi:hypothetical protein
MKKVCFAFLFGVSIVLCTVATGYATAYSDVYEGDYAFVIKAGTLGLSLEGIARLNPKVNARLGVNAFEYDYSGTESDIKYDFDLELFSVSALFDWHPFGNSFRTTIGLLFNQNSLDMKAKPAGSFEIGDSTYTAAQVGTLSGELEVEEASPYVGIGWGNALGREQKWTVYLDLGVVYQGSPKVNLASTGGSLSSDPTFQANLVREEQNLEDDLEEFKFYPVIAFGIAYKF